MNFANTVSTLALALSMAGGIGDGVFSIARSYPKPGPIQPINPGSNPSSNPSAIQPIKLGPEASPLRPRPQPPILRRHAACTKCLNPIG